jgi:putative transposase
MIVQRKPKKRLVERLKLPLMKTTAPNQMWSVDFMSDSLTDGQKFRMFNDRPLHSRIIER